ncbi:MAG TPA: metal-sensitive transcriptional regulator [Candidatus Parcubacteria bacterium]|nr:metal-sensitive transcriptional regulator [Candidatus Parcubacteria bacterium]
MKDNTQLINNIIGQLTGIERMIEDGKDCFDVLTQIKAARSAIDSLAVKYIEREFLNCLKACNTKEKEQTCRMFLKELIKRS